MVKLCKSVIINIGHMRYKILEHKSDYKIRAFGKDLPELFSNAAAGMMDFLYESAKCKTQSAKDKRIIKLQANDLKALLVDWLSELLYLTDTKNLAYTKFDFKRLTETKLAAEVFGFVAKAKDDIKAVTYHGLEINKVVRGWEAVVLFDI